MTHTAPDSVKQWRRELGWVEDTIKDYSTELRKVSKASQLRDNIRLEFMKRFQLTRPRNWILKGDYLREYIRHKLGDLDDALDHVEFFTAQQSGGATLLVSQPYGYDKARVEAIVIKQGWEFLDLEEWAWYYPGHANCFGILIPKSCSLLRKRKNYTCYYKGII